MFKSKWLTNDPAELFVCHGGEAGGSSGGTAGSYSDAVNASETNPGLGLGYPSTDFSGVYGDSGGGISGGGLGGDLSAFTAYAYSPDFSMTDPTTFVTFGPDATNFSTQGIGLSGPQAGFTGGLEGVGLANPANFGFPSDFGVGVNQTTPPSPPETTTTTSGGGGSGGGGLAGGGGGFTGGPSSGPTGFSEGPGPDVSTPAYAPGHNSSPGLANQLINMGWEGFNAYGQVPGMSNLNSWRDPQGNIHPLANFIRAGWANQRLYTPEYLADSFTDVGTSPQDAYEQLASRGHVPTPQYYGVQNLNTLGGLGPEFPSPFGSGVGSGVQRIPGVNPITLGPDGQLSDLGGTIPPLTPRLAAMLGIK